MVKILDNYTKPATVNPWIEELKNITEGIAFEEFITPTERTDKETGETKKSIAGTKSRIQDAARAHGFTARVSEEDVQDDGTVRVVFTVHKAQKSGPRGPRKAKD